MRNESNSCHTRMEMGDILKPELGVGSMWKHPRRFGGYPETGSRCQEVAWEGYNLHIWQDAWHFYPRGRTVQRSNAKWRSLGEWGGQGRNPDHFNLVSVSWGPREKCYRDECFDRPEGLWLSSLLDTSLTPGNSHDSNARMSVITLSASHPGTPHAQQMVLDGRGWAEKVLDLIS